MLSLVSQTTVQAFLFHKVQNTGHELEFVPIMDEP